MKPLHEKLRFHRYLLPGLLSCSEGVGSGEWLMPDPNAIQPIFECAESATLFDCRAMDFDFITDTGAASLDEQKELCVPQIRLPFENCYFEFGGEFGLLASETSAGIHFWLPNYSLAEDAANPGDTDDQVGLGLVACLHVPSIVVGQPLSAGEEQSDYRIGTELLYGITTLLNEHLLATEVRPDPAIRLNIARAKRGKLPVTGETRVLTINTGAVRRALRGARLLKHESPRLHWRRGHWRVMHRGSEFESKAWVRRCLVGDPARGSVHKDYRLIWNPPMLADSGM